MKILFDINHPAHVHLFKNFIFYLKKQGHTVIVTTREKDVTNVLLDQLQIPYISMTRSKPGFAAKFAELIKRDFNIIRLHQKEKFDVAFGTSTCIAHLTLLCGVPSYNFNEDDDDVDPTFEMLTYPFTTKIVSPDCIRIHKNMDKRVLYPSFHELAYLHPGNFTPDREVLKKYNLEEKKYIIYRKSALQATHDINAKGISNSIWNRIEEVIKGYPLVTSKEAGGTHQVAPSDMHHVLAFAKLLVCDSLTMGIEASVLGVPSVRSSTFIDKSLLLEDLEHKYGLTFGFYPGRDDDKLIDKLKEILFDTPANVWDEKRAKLLSEKSDFAEWMIQYWEKEIRKK